MKSNTEKSERIIDLRKIWNSSTFLSYFILSLITISLIGFGILFKLEIIKSIDKDFWSTLFISFGTSVLAGIVSTGTISYFGAIKVKATNKIVAQASFSRFHYIFAHIIKGINSFTNYQCKNMSLSVMTDELCNPIKNYFNTLDVNKRDLLVQFIRMNSKLIKTEANSILTNTYSQNAFSTSEIEMAKNVVSLCEMMFEKKQAISKSI